MLIGILNAKNDIITNTNQKSEMEILFVYNANSGLFNAITDYVHRQISPSTYSCNLCLITHDNWDRNQRWSTYIDSLPIKVGFMYKNTVNQYKELGIEVKLPMAFLINENKASVFITTKEINSCNDEITLIDLFNTKLRNAGIIK